MAEVQNMPDLAMDPRARAANLLKGRFEMFMRLGRWGTCACCPNDGMGHTYPELCVYTDRYDHQLTMDAMAESFNNEVKRQVEKKEKLGDNYRFAKP